MDAADTAKVFAALGHEGRIVVFQLLAAAGPTGLAAGEIARRTGYLQNTMSSLLAVLAHAGLVSARREGRSIIYAAHPDRLAATLGALTIDALDQVSAPATAARA